MPLKHLQHMQHPDLLCNIHMKHLQHTSETSETLEIYICNIRERWSGPVDSDHGARAPPARVALMGALGSAWDRPKARNGTTSTSRGGRHTRRCGWDYGSKERDRAGWARATGGAKSEHHSVGCVREDGCGDKSGVDRTDSRTAL